MAAFAVARDFGLHKFHLSEVVTTAGRLDREAKRQLIQTILVFERALQDSACAIFACCGAK